MPQIITFFLQLGLRVGLQVVHTVTCSQWGAPSDKRLFEDGDVIIGGLFSLRYSPPAIDRDFTQQPDYKPCSLSFDTFLSFRLPPVSLQNLPLQYIYAMVFALEEINHSTALLPGVKLGYYIRDSCALPPWAIQAALSLVGGDSSSCDTAALTVSYTASCPCLSDRRQFPNFFRTMASDIYQARAVSQLAIRFNWTWIGAVIANNDYGHMAVFQEEIQGAGVCLAFVETLQRENIVRDARRAALTIKASTAKVILIFTWYTDVRQHLTLKQFLASEAWSTSGDLLQNLVSSKVASGALGVAIRSSAIPGFENFLRNLDPSHRPSDEFLREFWEKEFGCSPGIATLPFHANRLLRKASLPLCNGTETLEDVQNLFTDTSQLRVTYNVYLAVYAAAHALHSLLSCRDSDSTRVANRKGEPVCCFDCITCADGEISNTTGSLHCERCPPEFWSNADRTACIARQLDFLSFNETLGITLTAVAVSGVTVTTAVFLVFLHHRQTPVVRANNSELSFLLLLSLKLCFLCSLVFIGRPAVWSCRFQQAAFGISFVLCVSCLQVKTIVVLAAFRSAQPGAEALMKWFGPAQQRGSVFLFTCVQVIICIIWLSISPPVPKPDLDVPGLKVTLKCTMASVVGFSLVLGYIGLLACTSLLLAFLARKLPDNFNEAKLITFSMLIFCAVWVAFVPAYVSSPGKYAIAVEIFAILASSYGLLFCIFQKNHHACCDLTVSHQVKL
uniref:Olfactory receptor C family, r1 n=1 Tax=Amphiprion percula TaxID=161767 RepID=A0A3P8S6F6_AMPPE